MFGWLARLLFNRDGRVGEAVQPSPDDIERRGSYTGTSWGGPSSNDGGGGSCDGPSPGGSGADGGGGGDGGSGGAGGGDGGGGGGSC